MTIDGKHPDCLMCPCFTDSAGRLNCFGELIPQNVRQELTHVIRHLSQIQRCNQLLQAMFTRWRKMTLE